MDKVQDSAGEAVLGDHGTWSTELEDLADTKSLGRRLARVVAGGDRIVLEGDLGAGKTELVRATLRALGVPKEVAVTSPTFGLVHEYPLPQGGPASLVVHADLYRIGSYPEADDLGLRELLDSETIGFVEWGERFQDLLDPQITLRLSLPAFLETGSSTVKRGLRAEAHDDRGLKILRELSRLLPSP